MEDPTVPIEPRSESGWKQIDRERQAAKDWALAVQIGKCATFSRQWNAWVIDARAVEAIADHNVREIVKAALNVPIEAEVARLLGIEP